MRRCGKLHLGNMNKEEIDGLPFVVTRKSKAAKFEQAVSRLMSEIVAGEESVGDDGWIDEADILSEFGERKWA